MDDKSKFVLRRLDEMRTIRSDFEVRWRANNQRVFAFTVADGSYHLSNAWRMIESLTDEICNEFDGSVVFMPRPESRIKEGFQYEYLTKVYNQLNKSIGIQQERKMAIKDALRYSYGVIFEGYIRPETGKDSFDYLITERVDPRDFFVDSSALQYYDPQGLSGATDCIRRRWYKVETFKKHFQNNELYNQKAIKKILEGGGEYKVNEEIGFSLLDVNEMKGDLVLVYEYWTNDKLCLYSRGNVFYEGENPYGKLPFVMYCPFLERETLYPPSLLEVVTPILKLKEVLANLWYMNARLSSTPVIFAAETTGLVAGQPLRPGVQTVKLSGQQDITKEVQQVRLGGVSQDLIGFMSFVDDELTKTASLDQRALNAKPDELATQTLQKVETELKSLRGIINTMMIGCETQRAFLRAKNILKFLFSSNRDLIINDHTMMKDGKMKAAKGSLATITISESEWKGMEFEINVESKKKSSQMQGELQDQLLRLLQISQGLMQDPTLAQRIHIDALFEQILATFPDIDTTKVFVQDKGVSQVQDDLAKLKQGQQPQPKFIDENQKQSALKAAMQFAIKETDPVLKRRALQYIQTINSQQPDALSQNDPTAEQLMPQAAAMVQGAQGGNGAGTQGPAGNIPGQTNLGA